jgi:TRAP-type C4-dicarboxylate transport system substrate-binding protein
MKPHRIDRRAMLRLGATACAGFASYPPGAFAQQKRSLKASDVHPTGYPTVEAVENLGRKLERTTNGRLSVQMFA